MSIYSKYIKSENIPAFRRYMSTRGNVPFHSFYDCMFTDGGKKRSIFTVSSKFEKMNKKTQSYGLYLAPATMINGLDVCRGWGACKDGCIAYTGNLSSVNSQNKQYMFTIALYHHTELFLTEIVRSILECAGRHVYLGEDIAIRLNSTSDLPFYMVIDMQALCNDIQNLSHFYDYTKIPNRWKQSSEYYHLTYSWSEKSTPKTLNRFDRVSIVVTYQDKKKLLKQYPDIFVDGDSHDLRSYDDYKYVLLGVKQIGGFNGMREKRKVSETFIQSIEQVMAILEGVQ
jgi:hypothetical protein